MAVRAGKHRVAGVQVVSVALGVDMFVVQRNMAVSVSIVFGLVSQHTGTHERAARP